MWGSFWSLSTTKSLQWWLDTSQFYMISMNPTYFLFYFYNYTSLFLKSYLNKITVYFNRRKNIETKQINHMGGWLSWFSTLTFWISVLSLNVSILHFYRHLFCFNNTQLNFSFFYIFFSSIFLDLFKHACTFCISCTGWNTGFAHSQHCQSGSFVLF